MDHKAEIRLVAGANTAIVFIHGIVGTPDHFDRFISLVPRNISIYNILLDGHGKHAIDFSRTSMRKWETQVTSIVQKLSSTHSNVYIVAHSMGTLFAIEQAVQCDHVRGLFLLAVPIKVGPKLLMFKNAFKVYRGKIRPDDRFGIAAKAACSITPSRNPLDYLGWITRYLELFRKIGNTRKILPELKSPCIAFQSALDEMVSSKSAMFLKANSCMDAFVLDDSYHYLYSSKDLQTILAAFCTFLEEIN